MSKETEYKDALGETDKENKAAQAFVSSSVTDHIVSSKKIDPKDKNELLAAQLQETVIQLMKVIAEIPVRVIAGGIDIDGKLKALDRMREVRDDWGKWFLGTATELEKVTERQNLALEGMRHSLLRSRQIDTLVAAQMSAWKKAKLDEVVIAIRDLEELFKGSFCKVVMEELFKPSNQVTIIPQSLANKILTKEDAERCVEATERLKSFLGEGGLVMDAGDKQNAETFMKVRELKEQEQIQNK